MSLSKATISKYIRQAAIKRNIDPDVALRVAASEGLNADPNEAWQSNYVKNGQRERSYGPYQLYIDGGLGNEFMRSTGLDPRDPSTWQQQVDYALDHARNNGWGAWYGAANVGIGNMDGISGVTSGQGALSQGAYPVGTEVTGNEKKIPPFPIGKEEDEKKSVRDKLLDGLLSYEANQPDKLYEQAEMLPPPPAGYSSATQPLMAPKEPEEAAIRDYLATIGHGSLMAPKEPEVTKVEEYTRGLTQAEQQPNPFTPYAPPEMQPPAADPTMDPAANPVRPQMRPDGLLTQGDPAMGPQSAPQPPVGGGSSYPIGQPTVAPQQAPQAPQGGPAQVTPEMNAQDAAAQSQGVAPEKQGILSRLFGSGEDGNPGFFANDDNAGFVKAIGWDKYTQEQRDNRWLAIGAGLLSGDDWASGGAAVAQNLMGLNQADRDHELTREKMEMQRQQQSKGGIYNRPFNIEGRNRETGEHEVHFGNLVDGIPHIFDDDGNLVPAMDTLRDIEMASRGSTRDIDIGVGGIPNAAAVTDEGVPIFSGMRSEEQKTLGYAIRAIGAYEDLESIWDEMGPENITSLRTALEQWAANNASGRVTAAALNTIIGNANLSGAAANTSRAFLQSILRRDTGAAYTGAEIADYAGAFLPAAGDDPQDVEQKRRLMRREMYSFIAGSGKAGPWLGGVLDGKYPMPAGLWRDSRPSIGTGALDSSNTGGGVSSETDDILKSYGL